MISNLIIVLALSSPPAAGAADAASAAFLAPDLADAGIIQQIERMRPDALSVELHPNDDTLAITVAFSLRDSGIAGELLFTVRDGISELSFIVDGRTHVHIRQIEAVPEHDQVWLSPAIQDELGRDAPELMLVFWAILTDARFFADFERNLAAA